MQARTMHDARRVGASIVIGTRPSKLALWQAEHVKFLIEEIVKNISPPRPVVLKKITTKGDKILDRSLVAVGGKGLFLKEIEDELLNGGVDVAVHSMKDVPYELPRGLVIAAMLRREDPVDAWVSLDGTPLQNLRAGAVIGTTSLRRKFQLLHLYPHLNFDDLRGNVDTRLQKLAGGEFDGIVLALAGLKRLGFAERMTHVLDLVPAAGQGAIGIECRENDTDMLKIVSALNDDSTFRCVNLEREFLKTVQGSCQTPVGCHVTVASGDPGKFVMRCFLSKPDGSDYFEKTVTGKWTDSRRIVETVFCA